MDGLIGYLPSHVKGKKIDHDGRISRSLIIFSFPGLILIIRIILAHPLHRHLSTDSFNLTITRIMGNEGEQQQQQSGGVAPQNVYYVQQPQRQQPGNNNPNVGLPPNANIMYYQQPQGAVFPGGFQLPTNMPGLNQEQFDPAKHGPKVWEGPVALTALVLTIVSVAEYYNIESTY